MTKNTSDGPEGLPDIFKIASDLADAFKLDEQSELALADALPYMRPERFALSYAEGEKLVLERAFGAELRALIARPQLSFGDIVSMDRLLFETVGIVEHVDYHGVERTMGMFQFADGSTDNYGARDQPRVAPVTPCLVVPILREALVVFLEQHTGKKADKRDWIKKPGRQPQPRKGAAADFFVCALSALGWDIDLKEMCKTHRAVLDANIRWDDYNLPEPMIERSGTDLEDWPATWHLSGSMDALTGEFRGAKFKVDPTFVKLAREYAAKGSMHRFDRHVCSDCGDNLVVSLFRESDAKKSKAVAFTLTRAGFPRPALLPQKLVAYYEAGEPHGIDTVEGPDHRCF